MDIECESDYFDEKFEHNCEVLRSLTTDWSDTPATDFGNSMDRSIQLLCFCGVIELQVEGECWNPDDDKFPRYHYKALVSGDDWLSNHLPREVKAATVGKDGPCLAFQNKVESVKARLTTPIGINTKFALIADQLGEVFYSFGERSQGSAKVKITKKEEPAIEILKEQTKKVLDTGRYAIAGGKEELEARNLEWQRLAKEYWERFPDANASRAIQHVLRETKYDRPGRENRDKREPFSEATIRNVIKK